MWKFIDSSALPPSLLISTLNQSERWFWGWEIRCETVIMLKLDIQIFIAPFPYFSKSRRIPSFIIFWLDSFLTFAGVWTSELWCQPGCSISGELLVWGWCHGSPSNLSFFTSASSSELSNPQSSKCWKKLHRWVCGGNGWGKNRAFISIVRVHVGPFYQWLILLVWKYDVSYQLFFL